MDYNFTKLNLVMRNTQTNSYKTLTFNIHQNYTAQKWAKYLLDDYINSNDFIRLEKSFALHGWKFSETNPNARNINNVVDELNWAIEKLNNYFVIHGVNYHISDVFTYDMDREDLNSLHHHFELLRGQVGNDNPTYMALDNGYRWLVNQLNQCCHELENMFRVQIAYEHRMSSSAIVMCMYNSQGAIRHDIEDKDYDIFVNENLDFGQLRMHYAQVGKTHREAFHDNDNDIHDENIIGIRYLSGEFDVNLNCGKDGEHMYDTQDWKNFLDWCTEKGLDINDKTLALGYAPLADLDKTQFINKNNFQIMEELYEYDDVFKIELYHSTTDGLNVLSGQLVWDYTWRELYDQQRNEYIN